MMFDDDYGDYVDYDNDDSLFSCLAHPYYNIQEKPTNCISTENVEIPKLKNITSQFSFVCSGSASITKIRLYVGIFSHEPGSI